MQPSAQTVFGWVLLGLACLVWLLPLHWLVCRLTARRCPSCGRKWSTVLESEWDGELWFCTRCHHAWVHTP